MSRRGKRAAEKESNKTFLKIIIVAIFLGLVYFVLKVAPNYINNEITDRVNLVINNTNVTQSLANNLIIEDGIIYISKEDIENFFDPYIYYDEQYDQIITTYGDQIANIVVGEDDMQVNGSTVTMSGTVMEKDDTYYIPLSSLKDVYNIEINYINSSNIITVDSLDRKYVTAESIDESEVKAYPTIFSRTIDDLIPGEEIIIVQNDNNENEQIGEWVEVRTDTGRLGYIKYEDLENEKTKREEQVETSQIDGKISMIWDYFSEYGTAPDRSDEDLEGVNVVSPTFFELVDEGQGKIKENVGEEGEDYIEWAHSNGYMVWPSLSNNSYIETTSEIMNDYNLRQELIENIVKLVKKYDLDGINIDFEYMHDEDRDLFSRFIIELKPQLSKIGAVLSVDVTAPDGSDEWSLCYDRNVIGKVADYIVFMGYDEHGTYAEEEGTNSGYDWLEANIEKFLGQEEVDEDKLILGIPFYVRVWKEENGEITNSAVDMKDLNDIIPDDATKTWDDELKQYYVEYEQDGIVYKIWMEEDESISYKLSLVQEYNLAGAAFWTKDRETSSVWSIISNYLGVD